MGHLYVILGQCIMSRNLTHPLLSVLLAGITVSASNADEATVYMSCIQNAVKRLDDKVSPADVVARGALSACDRTLRSYVDEKYSPEGVQRQFAKDAIRTGMSEKVIELVLESRAGASKPPQSPNDGALETLGLGSEFKGSIVASFHEKPSSAPGRFYESDMQDGSRITLIISDLPDFKGKIINIAQSYIVKTKRDCLIKYNDFMRNKANMEIKTEPNSLGDSEFSLQGVQSFSTILSQDQDITGMVACSRADQGYIAQIRVGYKRLSAEQYAKDLAKAADSAAGNKN